MLDSEFMRLAFGAGAVVGLLAPAVGFFLVQRRLSLIGDGIGHAAFAGVAAGTLLGISPVLTGLVAAVSGAVAVEWLRGRRLAAGDQALALIFYTGIAAGVVLISLAGSLDVNLFTYLFGSILTVTRGDLVLIALLGAVALGLIALFYRALCAVVVDEQGARVSGLPVPALERARGGAGGAHDRALDAHRRHPPGRRTDGAARDGCDATRMEPALGARALDGRRARVGAGRADARVLRRRPARRHDRARRRRGRAGRDGLVRSAQGVVIRACSKPEHSRPRKRTPSGILARGRIRRSGSRDRRSRSARARELGSDAVPEAMPILPDSMVNDTVETPTAAEAGVWTTGPDGELVPDYDSTFPTINEGEVVHGTVVRVDKDEVLVDIGYKSEGVIPVSELSIRRNVNPADEVGLGEEIDALVMTKEDAEGRLILSKKRARFELAWKAIEGAAESGEPVDGRVIEVVKGGLILDLGVRGFLPASLVDIRRVQDLDEFLGKELRCKVIELNRSRNNVVLSRRAVLEDERKEMRQAILDRLNPGDVVDGTISNIVDFGAFVDLDGMDGLIHISELSWSHVNHPSEILEIGQDVKVKVLDIDRDRQRISLGLKQTQSDPWQQVLDSYAEGDVVEGRVTKVVTFGAFVEILPGVEGLVHISELAAHHVENPREIVSQGDPVNVLVLEIDGERRRLSLSLKRVEDGQDPLPRPDGSESVHATPDLRLSEEAFPTHASVTVADDVEALEAEGAEVEAEEIGDAEPELVVEAVDADPDLVVEAAAAVPEPVVETADADPELVVEAVDAEPELVVEAAAEPSEVEQELEVEPSAAEPTATPPEPEPKDDEQS